MSSAVLACRPVDATELMKLFPPGTPEPNIYTGSIVEACSECGIDVYVGPRAQAYRAAFPETTVACMTCASFIAYKAKVEGGSYESKDLGNTEFG